MQSQAFDTSARWTLLAFVLILFIASLLIFPDLERAPAGGHDDVSWIGINALDWLDRGVQPFYIREMYAPEFLVVYAVGILAQITEISFLPSRLMTGLTGLLFVGFLFPATWWLLDGAPLDFRRRASLLASASAAVSLHAMHLSRLGMESPPFRMAVTLIIWLTAWAWARGGKLRWALAGAALAMAQYIYLPARLLPVVLALWIAYSWWAERERLKTRWHGWVILAAVALLLTLPALVLFISTPEAFTARADSGSAATGGWIWNFDTSGEGGLLVVLAKKIGLTLLAFGIRWHGPYTIMGQPVLAPLFFGGVLVALGTAISKRCERAYAWPILAIPVMLITDLISGAIVEIHALHQMGVQPFLYILSGIGLALLWQSLESRIKRPSGRRALVAGLLAAGLLPSLGGLYTYWHDVIPADYANSNNSWQLEQTDVDFSRRLLADPGRAYLLSYEEYTRVNEAWLLSDHFRQRRSAIDTEGILRVPKLPASLTILMAKDPYRPRHNGVPAQFDPRLWVLLVDRQVLLLPPLQADQAAELQGWLDQADADLIIGQSGQEIGTLYTGPTPRDWFAPRQVIDYSLDATFRDEIRLRGYTMTGQDLTPGALVYVTLYWQVLNKAPSEDYEIFVQIWDDQAKSMAQTHDFPYNGMYRSRIWRPGEIVATHHWMVLPDTLPIGRYTLVTGLFRLLQNERVSVSGPNADPADRLVRAPDLRHPMPLDPDFDPGLAPSQTTRFGDYFDVLGLNLALDQRPETLEKIGQARPGQTLTVEVAWETLKRPPVDYSLFLHLSAQDNAAPSAQADLLLGGSYPTGAWRPGDRMKTLVNLQIPDSLQPGTYTLWIGLYQWQTGERLVPMLGGSPQPDGRLKLADIRVTADP